MLGLKIIYKKQEAAAVIPLNHFLLQSSAAYLILCIGADTLGNRRPKREEVVWQFTAFIESRSSIYPFHLGFPEIKHLVFESFPRAKISN